MNGLHSARRPAARPEDRHLPRPARELPRRRRATPAAARRSTASPRPAASPCTWRRIASRSKRWTAPAPRSPPRARNAEANAIAEHRIPRSRCLRAAGRLCLRAPPVLDWWCSIRRPSPSRRQQPGGRRPRLQRDQPARPAPAQPGRHSGDLLLLAPHERGDAARTRRRSRRSTPNRTLRVLERRTQAQDHPILLTVPETHYLKCLILEVV